jgi:hypothetical protein
MSRSGYFHRPDKLFPRVVEGSEMEKWLEDGEDVPEQSVVWGDKKPSFKNLKVILDSKKNEAVDVKGKGQEKPKAKKAEGGSKKKAGTKKSHQNDD